MWFQPLGWEDSPQGGNSNPLQYTCLENPMDRGAWWATVYGVTKSQLGDQLKTNQRKSNMHPSLITRDGPLLLDPLPASSGQQPLTGAAGSLPFSPL